MEKPIEKGFGSRDSILASCDRMKTTFDRIQKQLDQIDKLLTIRLEKKKSHDYISTTTSHVLRHQDCARAATPPPLLPPVPAKTPPPPPPVSATTPLQHSPPVSVTTPPPPTPVPMLYPLHPRPAPLVPPLHPHPISVKTPLPPAHVSKMVPASVTPNAIVATSLPTRASPSPRVAPLSTKSSATTRVGARSPLQDWNELMEFFSTRKLYRKYVLSFGVNVQQRRDGFTGLNSLKTPLIWDVF